MNDVAAQSGQDQKQGKVFTEISAWAKELRYGKICVELNVVDGKIVGLEEVPERTRKIYRP